MITDGYVPENLADGDRQAGVVRRRATACWSCRPETDAAWHQVWQQFKAGA